jgi:hypothetical protein
LTAFTDPVKQVTSALHLLARYNKVSTLDQLLELHFDKALDSFRTEGRQESWAKHSKSVAYIQALVCHCGQIADRHFEPTFETLSEMANDAHEGEVRSR